MWFRLVVIAQLRIKVVGGNVEFWLGAGSLSSSWLVLVFPVTCIPRLRAHRQNLDFYLTNTTLLLNIFIIEKDIEEALANLET
jgi:hypothetical protein